MRVVIADDAALFREGMARLLEELGVEVAATADDANELIADAPRTDRRRDRRHPDAADHRRGPPRRCETSGRAP